MPVNSYKNIYFGNTSWSHLYYCVHSIWFWPVRRWLFGNLQSFAKSVRFITSNLLQLISCCCFPSILTQGNANINEGSGLLGVTIHCIQVIMFHWSMFRLLWCTVSVPLCWLHYHTKLQFQWNSLETYLRSPQPWAVAPCCALRPEMHFSVCLHGFSVSALSVPSSTPPAGRS